MDEWRARLVEENLGLVERMAREVYGRLPKGASLEYGDLEGWGRVGLVEAARRFDPRHGASFTTFAYYRIRGAMYDELRRLGYMRDRRLKAVAAMEEYLERSSDTTPLEVLRSLALVYTLSLDAPSGDGDDGEPTLQVGDPAARPPEEGIASRELRAMVERLPYMERVVVEKHYFEGWDFVDIAEHLGRSKSWVSRLHARAISRLREGLDG